MRIKHMSKLVYDLADDYKLENCEVVIDGQNFFYQLYKHSGLQARFGCESDKYAQYLRSYLIHFKKANVKCYFFFKGGNECSQKNNTPKTIPPGLRKTPDTGDKFKPPIFTKDIYKQVLEEMNFAYVICQFEAKMECIAFAQKHNCPIISNDIEFSVSEVRYIPLNFYTGKVDVGQCKLFMLDDFMRKLRLNEEKLAIFIVLTDEHKFPENHFQKFMEAIEIPLHSNEKRNMSILNWLSVTKCQTVLNMIFKYAPSDQKKFLEMKNEVMAFIRRQKKQGLPSQFFENQGNLQFVGKDPQWFEKGVVTQAVAIPYINLYRSNTFQGSWAVVDNGAPDPMLLSLDIIKYAFSLLWDFRKKEFNFETKTSAGTAKNITIEISSNFRKPNYTAVESPFENGWSEVRSFGLFEHFLMETLPMFDLKVLETLPEDARLLIIALVYFSRKKNESTINEVCSVLLSYLALNILSEVECKDPVDTDLASRAIVDATIEEDSIVYQDKLVARRNLAEYLDELPKGVEYVIYSPQRIHILVEFQHCLDNFNFLNRLCGRPYQPTLYSKTFNGTLVHRVLYALKRQAVCPVTFFENKLNQAPTVLAFWNRLIGAYKQSN